MDSIHKYPRTRHIEGSGLPKGNQDREQIPWAELAGKYLVVEEKLDGANVGIRFGPDGDFRLQCRGHYLTGGPGEHPFGLLKTWVQCHQYGLYEVLGSRYILFGEWLYAKHTVYYDALPHYFMEFDILDTETGAFLSTPRRQEMLAGQPIVSVPVLQTGAFRQLKEITSLVRPSLYKTPRWRERLAMGAREVGSDPEFVLRRETDNSDFSEGLYIKWEQDGEVKGRYKWIRRDFIAQIIDSGSHWRDRPLVKNELAEGIDIFALTE
jgi:hypothetical protein